MKPTMTVPKQATTVAVPPCNLEEIATYMRDIADLANSISFASKELKAGRDAKGLGEIIHSLVWLQQDLLNSMDLTLEGIAHASNLTYGRSVNEFQAKVSA